MLLSLLCILSTVFVSGRFKIKTLENQTLAHSSYIAFEMHLVNTELHEFLEKNLLYRKYHYGSHHIYKNKICHIIDFFLYNSNFNQFVVCMITGIADVLLTFIFILIFKTYSDI